MNHKEVSQEGFPDAQKYPKGVGFVNDPVNLREKGLLPESFEVTEQTQDQELLQQAILEYQKGPLTTELVDTTWQRIWKIWGESINHAFQVPSCDRTSEELVELQKEGKAVLLVPDELYTKEGLVRLGRIFPNMRSWSVSEETTVINDHDNGGAIAIEMAIDPPHRNTNETQALAILKKQGLRGQRLATYIIGSQFSKLLTGRYLDEGSTSSRLLGSRRKDSVLSAGFVSSGFLGVGWFLESRDQSEHLGFRSEGVKKA